MKAACIAIAAKRESSTTTPCMPKGNGTLAAGNFNFERVAEWYAKEGCIILGQKNA